MKRGGGELGDAASLEPTVLGSLARHRLLATFIVVLALAAAVLLGMRSGGGYSATMELIVRDPRATQVFTSSGTGSPERYVEDQATILNSTNVALQVIESAAEHEPPILVSLDELTSSRQVNTDPDSNRVTVSVQHEVSNDAISLANLFIPAYERVRTDAATADTEAALQQLDDTIAEIDSELSDLSPPPPEDAPASLDSARREQLLARRETLVGRRDEIELDAQLASSGIVFVAPAVEATELSGDTVRLVIAAGVIGLMIAAGVSYLLSLRRNDFTDRRQPEQLLGAPLVADIPEFASPHGSLPIVVAPTSQEAEAFRFAAASVRLLVADARGAAVAVISAATGEGKTSLLANMAIALAEDGLTVVAVDADLVARGLTSLLAGPDSAPTGLRDVLDGAPITKAIQRIQPWPGGPTFDLLGAGRAGMADRTVAPAPMAEALNVLRAKYDIVLIDTPPLLQVAAAGLILSLADSALAVIAHNGSVSRAVDLADRVALSDCRLLGYVYNKDPRRGAMTAYYVLPDQAPSRRQAWQRR